jgi:ornithine cyclodeaminase/alanine dehydrogenase-like protein (mu-crystallin family)
MEEMNSSMIKESDIYAELGEVLSGSKEGRPSDNDITLFKSVGVAIYDMARPYDVFLRSPKERNRKGS